jgi:hypothetical protein
MNEITCRGCGKPENECTCNVPTKDIQIIELQARIKELETLVLTKEDIELSIINKMVDIMLTKIWEVKDDGNYCHYITIAPPNPLCNTYQDGFIRGANEGMSKLICAVATEYNIKLEAKLQAIIEGDR